MFNAPQKGSKSLSNCRISFHQTSLSIILDLFLLDLFINKTRITIKAIVKTAAATDTEITTTLLFAEPVIAGGLVVSVVVRPVLVVVVTDGTGDDGGTYVSNNL